MFTGIYALLLSCSLALGLFGFFVGRCARRLPIIDDNMPRAMHRTAMQPSAVHRTARPHSPVHRTSGPPARNDPGCLPWA